jgi:hypothetical protein
MLKYILMKHGGRWWMGIIMAHDRDQWWVLVNTVWNLQFPLEEIPLATGLLTLHRNCV